jgi:hypothetical protein
MSKQPKGGSELPHGWYDLIDAKSEPRRIGDAYWNYDHGQWVVLPDEATTQAANHNNWPAIRHTCADPLEAGEAFEVVASFRLPIPLSQLGRLGKLVESTHKPNELFIRQTGPYLEFVRNRETG